MRQCVVVVGSQAEMEQQVPEIRQGKEGVARRTVWYACKHQKSPSGLLDDIDNALQRALRWPSLLYQCYLYISSVKTWSGKRPYVFVRGHGPAASLAARAAVWAGGDVVQSHDDTSGRVPQARYLVRDDGSLVMLD